MHACRDARTCTLPARFGVCDSDDLYRNDCDDVGLLHYEATGVAYQYLGFHYRVQLLFTPTRTVAR